MIILSTSNGSAVQKAALGENRYSYGSARYFYDKNHPQGTPNDGKINVIVHVRGEGTVIARVDSEREAVKAIEANSGSKVRVQGAPQNRRERNAEGRNS